MHVVNWHVYFIINSIIIITCFSGYDMVWFHFLQLIPDILVI